MIKMRIEILYKKWHVRRDKINLAAKQEWLDARVNRDLFTTSHSPRGCFLSQDRAQENFIIRPYLLPRTHTHTYMYMTPLRWPLPPSWESDRDCTRILIRRCRSADDISTCRDIFARLYSEIIYGPCIMFSWHVTRISQRPDSILTLAILTILTFRILDSWIKSYLEGAVKLFLITCNNSFYLKSCILMYVYIHICVCNFFIIFLSLSYIINIKLTFFVSSHEKIKYVPIFESFISFFSRFA